MKTVFHTIKQSVCSLLALLVIGFFWTIIVVFAGLCVFGILQVVGELFA